MDTEQALRAAVLADPNDDLPRLAYADWCEENGRLAYANFIRSQLANPNDNLTSSFDGATFHWQRGFIEEVHCPLDWWLKYGPLYVHKCPVRRVCFTDHQPAAYVIQLPPKDRLPSFDSPESAIETLSQTCLTWAKEQSPQEHTPCPV